MARTGRTAGKRPADDYARKVADAIIEQLRQGTAPWTKPWEPGQSSFLPHNAQTGKPYRGANTIWLMARQQAEGWDDTRWLTYRQAAKLGAQVRGGEKGTPIQFWMFRGEEPVIDPATGKPKKDSEGKVITRTVEYDRPRVFTAVVFNAAQVDGMPPPPPPRTTPEWERHERAEAILAASGATILHQDGNRAYYALEPDHVVLPERGQFKTADRYYGTALHELGHWTGHPDRLGRDMAHPFGSEAYAREELRAEIASLMLGDQLGIGHDPGSHVAYVQSWIKALQEDPKEILRASADAEKIATYVLELAREKSVEQTQEDTEAVVGAEVLFQQTAPAAIREPADLDDVRAAEQRRRILAGYEPPTSPGFRYHVVDATEDVLVLSVYPPGASAPLGQAEYRILPDGVETTTEAPEFVQSISPDEVRELHRVALEQQASAGQPALAPRASADAPAPLLAGLRSGEYEYDVLEASDGRLVLAAYRDGKSLGTCAYAILPDDVQCQGVGYAYTEEIDERLVRSLYNAARTRQDLAAAATPDSLLLYADQQTARLDELANIQLIERHRDPNTLSPHALDPDDEIKACRNRKQYAFALQEAVCSRSDARYWLRYGPAISTALKAGRDQEHPLSVLMQRLQVFEDQEVENGSLGPITEPVVAPPVRPPLALPVTIHPETAVPPTRVLLAVPYSQRGAAYAAGARFDRNVRAWVLPEGVPPDRVATWMPGHQRTAEERTYLDVPFKEKTQASDLGARLDRELKRWFIPPGLPLAAFERWMPRQPEAATEPTRDPRAEFTEALQAAGLQLGEEGAVMDGTLHRVPVEGDKPGERSGAYKGYTDGHPAGYVQNFRTGEKTNWKFAGRATQVSSEDRARLLAEAADKLAARERARTALHEAAATTIRAELAGAPLASDDHRYLQKKGVPSLGLRTDAKGQLLVPVQKYDGTIVSSQTIRADGRKGMAKDTGIAAGMYVLQDGKGGVPLTPGASPKTILIVEGYATGASVHRATGLPTVVAFNSGNLAAVAQEIRKHHPQATICIAADNDHENEKKTPPKPNVGRLAAEEAAAEIRGHVLLPHFNGAKGSDWNDLERHGGAEFMTMQLRGGVDTAEHMDAAHAARAAEKASPARAPVAAEVER